jgi:hypothetical protein
MPYSSPDCMALHCGFKKHIGNSGFRAELYSDQARVSREAPYPLDGKYKNMRQGAMREIQYSLIDKLERRSLSHLYYPIVDTIVRKVDYVDLFSARGVSEGYLDYLEECEESANILCNQYSSLYLADSAYVQNQILKHTFLSSGRSVYYLNPNGRMAQFSKQGRGEDRFVKACIDKADAILMPGHQEIYDYIDDRFSGRSLSDGDSGLAFKNANTVRPRNTKHKKRKVLFLHCFRDANNISWEKDEVFSSYLDWVESSVKAIDEFGDWSEWYIKIHPSAGRHKYHLNERQIVDTIKKLYNIPQEVFDGCPATSEILNCGYPIYANKGTIILEAAAVGRMAIYCGTRYGTEFGLFAGSRRDWINLLCAPTSEVEKLTDNQSKQIMELARTYLYLTFNYFNIGELCPPRPLTGNSRVRERLHAVAVQGRNSELLRFDLSNVFIPKL